jgi:hypothetical protein
MKQEGFRVGGVSTGKHEGMKTGGILVSSSHEFICFMFSCLNG